MKRLFACLLFLVAALPAVAAPLSDADKADVVRVEAYMNSVKTLSGRFLQLAPDGQSSEGKFWLSRPGRLRFEYDPPVPVLVVGDGTFLIFRDNELNQTDRVPIGSTPIGVLVRENVKLSGDLTVDSVERQKGILRVTVFDTVRPREGKLTMTFDDGTQLALRQWRVLDARGQSTNVSLSAVEVNQPVERRLFVYIDKTKEEIDRDNVMRGRK